MGMGGLYRCSRPRVGGCRGRMGGESIDSHVNREWTKTMWKRSFEKAGGVPKPPPPLYLPKNDWCVSQCTYGCILRNERDGEMENVHARTAAHFDSGSAYFLFPGLSGSVQCGIESVRDSSLGGKTLRYYSNVGP